MTDLTLANAIEFHELVVHRVEGRPPLLGCPYVRRYLEVDEDTLTAVEAIKANPSLRAASDALLAQTGEEWDLVELANRLKARGFVQKVDGQPIKAEKPVRTRHRWLYRVPVRALQWLHHPVTIAATLLLVAAWVATIVRDHALMPTRLDLVLVHDPALYVITSFAGLFGFAYLHELAHFYTARSYGVDPKITIGRRMYVPTLQTDVSNAWTIAPRKQAHIFLAGILFNLGVASALGLVVAGMKWGYLPHAEWIPYLRFGEMVNVFPLMFQLFFFARTDLYFLLLAVTGERNLYSDARGYVRLRARRLWRLARGTPAERCVDCGRRVFEDEPFCVRCGALHQVADINKYPFEAARRRRLLAWGFVFYGGFLAALYLLLKLGIWLYAYQVFFAYAYVMLGYHAHDWLRLLDGSVILALAVAQLGFVLYFMGGAPIRLARKALARRAVPSPAPPVSVPVDVVRVRSPQTRATAAARKRRKNRAKRRARR